MVLFDVLREGYVDVASQERVVLGLDEVFIVLFHGLSQFGVRDGVGLLYAVQIFYLLVEALQSTTQSSMVCQNNGNRQYLVDFLN